jgi:hypothetical protein
MFLSKPSTPTLPKWRWTWRYIPPRVEKRKSMNNKQKKNFLERKFIISTILQLLDMHIHILDFGNIVVKVD